MLFKYQIIFALVFACLVMLASAQNMMAASTRLQERAFIDNILQGEAAIKYLEDGSLTGNS